jgi:hypothetical protein
LVGVSPLEGANCEVTLSNGTTVARYGLAATADAAVPDASPDPYCAGGSFPGDAACMTVSGPVPDICSRNDTCVLLRFNGPALRSFLGDAAFIESVSCDGHTVIDRAPQMIMCPTPL